MRSLAARMSRLICACFELSILKLISKFGVLIVVGVGGAGRFRVIFPVGAFSRMSGESVAVSPWNILVGVGVDGSKEGVKSIVEVDGCVGA